MNLDLSLDKPKYVTFHRENVNYKVSMISVEESEFFEQLVLNSDASQTIDLDGIDFSFLSSGFTLKDS